MNYTVRKLTAHASANCRVRVYDNGDLVLQSYATDVIYYDKAHDRVFCTGLYSMTTRKHITWFLREYIPLLGYEEVKCAYVDGIAVNSIGQWALSLTKDQLDTLRSASHGSSLHPGML